MPVRTATAQWRGNLARGNGTIALGSGAFNGAYDFASRFEEGTGTNPEELIGAAHAGCFSMALAHGLALAGFNPGHIETNAKVTLSKMGEGFGISQIHLITTAQVPHITPNQFQTIASDAKTNCPVSRALTSIPITLEATLLHPESPTP